MEATCE